MVDTSQIRSVVPDVSLPRIFPERNLVVEDEEHRFDVVQVTDDNTTASTTGKAKLEYELNKAPAEKIRTVTGQVNGSKTEFTEGTDYELAQDGSLIRWRTSTDTDTNTNTNTESTTNIRQPDAGTTFFVTYKSDSILNRYISSTEEEFSVTQDKIVDSINSKYIDTASGEDLDRIGSLFGDVIGDRRGRDDDEYREYLQSVVRSFVSRGTQSGIRLAVSAAINVDIENIEIQEDFEDSAYFVNIVPTTRIRGSTVAEIADVADPSGIRYNGARYQIFDSGNNFSEGPSVSAADTELFTEDAAIPDDFIDPINPAVNITDSNDVFNESISDEIKQPFRFKWAQQRISVESVGSGNSWNQFQWGDEWASPKEVEIEFIGDKWNFADWNRIPSQGTFGPTGDDGDTQFVTDNSSLVVADRSPDDSAGITDEPRVRLLVGTEDVSMSDDSFVNITQFVSDSVSFETAPITWGSDWNELEWADTQDGTVGDVVTASSSPSIVDDAVDIAWGAKWGELEWDISNNNLSSSSESVSVSDSVDATLENGWGDDWNSINWVAN